MKALRILTAFFVLASCQQNVEENYPAERDGIKNGETKETVGNREKNGQESFVDKGFAKFVHLNKFTSAYPENSFDLKSLCGEWEGIEMGSNRVKLSIKEDGTGVITSYIADYTVDTEVIWECSHNFFVYEDANHPSPAYNPNRFLCYYKVEKVDSSELVLKTCIKGDSAYCDENGVIHEAGENWETFNPFENLLIHEEPFVYKRLQ